MALPKPPLKPATRLDMTDIPTPRVRRARKSTAKTAIQPVSEAISTQAEEILLPPSAISIVKETATPTLATQERPQEEKAVAKKVSTKQATAVPRKTATRTTVATKKQIQGRAAVANEAHKLFILDTNVMLHDPTCLFRFQEHNEKSLKKKKSKYFYMVKCQNFFV